jgi:hypothetical protein
LLAPRPTPILEDQVSVFISPRGRVATHFSCLLWHAWVTVGLFLFPSHHMGMWSIYRMKSKSLCFNSIPLHEGVLEEWRYSSTHLWHQH